MSIKESRRAAQRRWYQKNRQSILEKRAKYYEENKSRLQKYGREYDKKRRSNKQKDTSKDNSNRSLKAIAEVRSRLLQKIDEY